MLTYLLILGAIAVVLLVVLGMVDSNVMPLACPKCYAGPDEDIFDRPRSWYEVARSGRVRCRTCHRWFKEHPDGSLVEDPNGYR